MSEYYQEMATALRLIADGIEKLSPDLPESCWVQLTIQPGAFDDAEKIAAIDALGRELLSLPGQALQMSGGGYHYVVRGEVGPVNVSVYNSVASPAEREREDELARLRAEVERLQSTA